MPFRGSILFLLALFLASSFLVYAALAREEEYVSVVFFDVGQGDSIYIEGPTGIQVLIDGGPDKTVLSKLGAVMPFYDRSLDAVFATHPDKDHIAGLVDVIERYSVSYFFEPEITNDTAVYRALEEAVGKKEIKKILARRGMKLSLGGGAELQILFPDRDMTAGETNASSVVAALRYGKTCFLLTGDAPKQVERYLVELETSLRCDVLKVGHHGSRTSTAPEFLAAVSPAYAAISAGKDNRYGHPHKEVLESLEKLGIPYFSTQNGSVRFRSDGSNVAKE